MQEPWESNMPKNPQAIKMACKNIEFAYHHKSYSSYVKRSDSVLVATVIMTSSITNRTQITKLQKINLYFTICSMQYCYKIFWKTLSQRHNTQTNAKVKQTNTRFLIHFTDRSVIIVTQVTLLAITNKLKRQIVITHKAEKKHQNLKHCW